MFVQLLVDHGVTHLVSVPSILRLLLPALSAARDRLGLQLLVSSGEPLAVAAAAELQRALPPGASLLNLYGAAGVQAAAQAAAAARFVRVQLSAEQLARVVTAPGVSPAMAATYFRTGDVGFVTPPPPSHLHDISPPGSPGSAGGNGGDGGSGGCGGGCLVLLGRLDAQLKLPGGVRLNLAELEAALAAHPAVAEAAAVMLPGTAGRGSGGGGGEADSNHGGQGDAAGAGLGMIQQAPGLPPAVAAYICLALAVDGAGQAGQVGGEGVANEDGGLEAGLARPLAQVRPELEPQLQQWLDERLPPLPPWSPASRPDQQQGQLAQGQGQGQLQREQPAAPPSEVEVMRALVAATGLTRLEATTDVFRAGATSLAAVEAAALLGVDVRLLLSYPTARRLAAALGAGAAAPQGLEGDRGGETAGRDETSARPAAKRLRLGEAAAAVAVGAKTEVVLQAPLVAVPVGEAQGVQGEQEGVTELVLVLACSHDGDVACLDAATGLPYWHQPSHERDSSAPAGQAADGWWAVDCGGEFKCAPATDPWLGCVWATSHGRALVVMRPPGQLLAR
eukprot:XP_001696855.1 predicted protein [Chlamydomonas reinhardtii]